MAKARSVEQLQAATEWLCGHYAVSHFVYHWVNSSGERFGAGTYTQDWIKRYLEKDYLRMDPVILGCVQRFHPVNWKDLDWSGRAARAFFQEAVRFGVGNQGYSIPIRGPNGQFAIFSVSHTCTDDEWADFLGRNARDLMILAHEFNRAALAIELDEAEAGPAALSPRELTAMNLLAKGNSRAQVAAEMQISEHTLRVYIESARHKLGAINTTHAVARALSQGLILI